MFLEDFHLLPDDLFGDVEGEKPLLRNVIVGPRKLTAQLLNVWVFVVLEMLGVSPVALGTEEAVRP